MNRVEIAVTVLCAQLGKGAWPDLATPGPAVQEAFNFADCVLAEEQRRRMRKPWRGRPHGPPAGLAQGSPEDLKIIGECSTG